MTITKFETGRMYWLDGHGFPPLKILSRSKTGKTVLCMIAGDTKQFRLKVRVNPRCNSEFVVTDPSYKPDSWQWDELSCYANRPLKEAEQTEWERG